MVMLYLKSQFGRSMHHRRLLSTSPSSRKFMPSVTAIRRSWWCSFCCAVGYAAVRPAFRFDVNVRAQSTCSTIGRPLQYTLVNKWQKSPDSWLLRFALPKEAAFLTPDPTIPTCIKVQYEEIIEEAKEGGTEETNLLEKSYSPVSLPSAKGTVDLIVKGYPPAKGGGVGAHLCSRERGDSITASVKSQRVMHGSPIVTRRWTHVGLVAGGTGIAPLLQIARILLADPEDSTQIRVLFVNRKADDILMREELDGLAKEHEGRFAVVYSLTEPEDGWAGASGRGTAELAREALPPPSKIPGDATKDGIEEPTTMILVCGSDGFVDTWGGPIGRGPKLADGSKGPKIQGPLLGILKEAGYDESQVFKY